MRPLRGLLIDDDAKNFAPIEGRMNFEFAKLGCIATWAKEDSSLAASELIRDSNIFDFAIVDLFYDEESPDGLELIKQLRNRDSRTFIVLVTQHASWLPDYRDKAASFCNRAVDRLELRKSEEWGFGSLARKIHQHVVFAGLVEAGLPTFDEGDPDVLALLEEIGYSVNADSATCEEDAYLRRAGARTIRNLVIRCLDIDFDEDVAMRIGYVAEGRSGSHVCRVEVSRPGLTEAFILKFGLDRAELDREFKANGSLQRVIAEQGMVAFMGVPRRDDSGYHAIIMRVASDAMPLSKWFVDAAAADDAVHLADALFSELLRPLFGRHCRTLVDTRRWLKPSVGNVVHTRAALDKYEPLLLDTRIGRHWNCYAEFRLLRAFLVDVSALAGSVGSLPEKVQFVKGFGDLHSGNVLVQGNVHPRPVLVDASLHGDGHWAADASRLIVDIFLRIRGSGVEAMLWDDLEASLQAGMRLCPVSYEMLSSAGGSVEAFLGRAVTEAGRYTQAVELAVLADEWHWQWHAAIGKEFLRQASHADLSPARAVLGLILGARHLRWSMLLLRRSQFRGRNSTRPGGSAWDQSDEVSA